MQTKEHWENVYSTKAIDTVSWYQQQAEPSLSLIQSTRVGRNASIIDIGGGASVLVDNLLAAGYLQLHVLDIAAAALTAARQRLGTGAGKVTWLEDDITAANLPSRYFDVWHDRAVFHFLTTDEQRTAYIGTLRRSLKMDGHLIVATFAEDGPEKCSGLSVQRYSVEDLQAVFGNSFTLLSQRREEHRTPSGTVQKLVYCHFRRSTVHDSVHSL